MFALLVVLKSLGTNVVLTNSYICSNKIVCLLLLFSTIDLFNHYFSVKYFDTVDIVFISLYVNSFFINCYYI